MTIENAVKIAKSKLTEAFKGYNPIIFIEDYDGVLGIKEARQKYRHTPCLLISPLTSDDSKIEVAVYLLATSTDKNINKLLDTTIDTLRHLSGDDREMLDVTSRAYYDSEAYTSGLRIWAHIVSWTHLANGEASKEVESPVEKELKRIKALFGTDISVGTDVAKAKELNLKGVLPFVTILAGDGSFDKTERKMIYGKKDNGHRFKASLIGTVTYPITIKAYATSQSIAENLIWEVVPYLPNTSNDENGFITQTVVSKLSIGQTESGAFTASVEVRLTLPSHGRVFDLTDIDIRSAGIIPEE